MTEETVKSQKSSYWPFSEKETKMIRDSGRSGMTEEIVPVKVRGPRLDKPGRFYLDRDEDGNVQWLVEKNDSLFCPEGMDEADLNG